LKGRGKMEEQKNFWDIFKSRKFWVLVLALLAATAAFAYGNIDGWQYIQALIVALAAYSTGVAIEDAGLKAGARISNPGPKGVLREGTLLNDVEAKNTEKKE
jgi:hypothetical protein